MLTHPDIDALARILPTEFGRDEELDWGAVEVELGMRLPSDYRAFMGLYGCGAIYELGILRPVLYKKQRVQWIATFADETPTMQEMWDMDRGGEVVGSPLTAEAVLAWGYRLQWESAGMAEGRERSRSVACHRVGCGRGSELAALPVWHGGVPTAVDARRDR
ncbi:hypothetical protein GCM10020000_31210 [Streptomyces olivoverticillatus]